MIRLHNLHGRVKRFWLFMGLTSLVAFIANIATQMVLQGQIDLQRAITLSLTLGIVLAIVMSAQQNSESKK
jgi:hypothetical protein